MTLFYLYIFFRQKHIESFSHVCACSLVGVHLARGDTKAALVAYETGTKRFKTFMPEIKTRLIEQLILDKDMTGIKKIKGKCSCLEVIHSNAKILIKGR